MLITSKPIHVLHLISSLEVGGAEKLLLALLNASKSRLDINYSVLVMNSQVDETLRQELLQLNIPVYFMNRPLSHKHPKYLFWLLKIIRQRQINIIHTHDPGSKLLASLCKPLALGLKVLYTFHDTIEIPNINRRNLLLHKHVLDHHIAISQSVLDQCQKADIVNVRCIYNGIDLFPFDKVEKEKSYCGQVPLRIVQVSRFETAKKGQDTLLEALRLCVQSNMDVRCRLVGNTTSTTEPMLASLRQLVRELDLEDRVEFVVNRTDIPQQLSDQHLFVLPSRYEGFGLVVIEAMASGLPVIASDIDGPREIIQDGRNGFLFSPNTPQTLFEKIKAVYFKPDIIKEIIHQGFQTAQQYDIAIMADSYANLYQEMIDGRDGTVKNHQKAAVL
ncbi:MAG: glycosyltransferase family 4 protein [Vampirovibrio sp.]|nr:glycosyltransferase family 4 protein [Vampirovibrio sp.]